MSSLHAYILLTLAYFPYSSALSLHLSISEAEALGLDNRSSIMTITIIIIITTFIISVRESTCQRSCRKFT